MTELEKIQSPKRFLDQLAAGVNPVDGTPIPEGDVARQARVTGCFHYVSLLLDDMIQKRIPRWAKVDFSASPEELMRYHFPPEPIAVSRFVQAVNDTVDLSRVRSLTVRDLTDWMTAKGLLREEGTESGGKHRIPTEQGEDIGIASAEKTGRNGRYHAVTYNVKAQTYLLDHMGEIAAHAAERWREKQRQAEENKNAARPAENEDTPENE